MARRVFFHIGAPKTGTTYLQRIMWNNRARLRRAGVLIPGADYRDRVWATQTVREMGQRHPSAGGAWDRIVEQTRRFDGDVVISHEFFGAASAEQAERAIAAVAPAEVHVVFTARDLTRLLPALWQERLKYRFAGEFESFDPEPVTSTPRHHWSWRTIDAADALQRWTSTLSPERVHLVTVPGSSAPRDLLWQRFAQACSFDADLADLDLPSANESMGVVESELLRRVNPRLGAEIAGPNQLAVWVRDYLGLEVLASRKGERFGLSQAMHTRLRERSLAIAEEVRRRGYDVVGDLDDLIPPVEAADLRTPADVTDAELLDASLDVIARLLSDYRRASRQRNQLRRVVRQRRPEGTVRRTLTRLRRRIS